MADPVLKIAGASYHGGFSHVVGEVMTAIRTYVAGRGAFAGHLLQSYQQSYANPTDALTPKYVSRLAGNVFRRAGIAESDHALRNTFATELINNGSGIRDAQVALGHVSIATTQRYTPASPRSGGSES
jgi:site-specific recombinase XerD